MTNNYEGFVGFNPKIVRFKVELLYYSGHRVKHIKMKRTGGVHLTRKTRRIYTKEFKLEAVELVQT